MFNLYPRPSARSRGGEDVGVVDVEDGDVARYRALYGISVVCVSIFLFCVLAATVSVWKASVFAATAALLLVVLGCSVSSTWVRRSSRGRPSALLVLTARGRGGEPPRAPGGCACVAAVDAPPAFAYAVEGGGEQTSGCAMCSVCLEDVLGGEMVRRLPACTHVFHVECIDMWLRSHRTCPMCRCVVSRKTTAVTAVTAKGVRPEQALPEPSEEEEELSPV